MSKRRTGLISDEWLKYLKDFSKNLTKEEKGLMKKPTLAKISDAIQPNVKVIPGFDGRYTISKQAVVYDTKNKRVLEPHLYGVARRNYHQVSLYKKNENGRQKKHTKRVHVLMAYTFLNHKACGHKIVVDHIDENIYNNNLNNLQILTNQQNCNKARTIKKHLQNVRHI